VALSCPEHDRRTRYAYPTERPASTSTPITENMIQGATMSRRRGPPRRCDRTLAGRP
jgi:hypothetical protein